MGGDLRCRGERIRGVETGEVDDDDELAEPQRPAACRCARDFRENHVHEKGKGENKLHQM